MPDAPSSLDEMIAALRWARGQILAGDKFAAPLNATLAQLEASRWRPIESAPKDGTILVAIPHQFTKGVFVITSASWYAPASDTQGWYIMSRFWGKEPTQPSHWMPLPAPPAVASEGDGA